MSRPTDVSIGVLFLDDGTPECDAVKRILKSQPRLTLFEIHSLSELEAWVKHPSVDLILSDLKVWDSRELEVLERARAIDPQKPVVLITSRGSERWAVEAMQCGAADYISTNTPGFATDLREKLGAAVARFDSPGDRFLSQSLDLLSIAGFDGYLKRWSSSWQDVMGYSYDDIMLAHLPDLIHPDDLANVRQAGVQLRAGQRVRGEELRLRSKDGSYKWLLWNATPCVEEELYFFAAQDITSRKLVEEQLRESQVRFQLIASATNEAVWDWDLRANRLWRNDSYNHTFGDADSQNVIEWWRQRIHPEDLERVLAEVPVRAVDGRQQWAMKYRLRRLDGTYAHVYDRGSVVFDEPGEPLRMVGSLMDITELTNTEEKLRESDERFRLAAKATQDAIWDWDLDRGQVWRSDSFQTLFGYSAADICGEFSWWIDRVHPEDRERVLSTIPSPESDSRQCAMEYRFRRADGSYADVFDRGFVMCGPSGKPTRMVGTVTDISERRRAEELAHMQRSELAHIARISTMGEIATGLAHELNQPLTAISNYAESCARAIAAKTPANEEKLLSWIEKISVNTHRAGEMIRRLRSFARKSEPRRSTVEINELIHEVIDLLEADTRLQNVRVRWESADSVYAVVDRIQIQQVLVNLLLNAYEAMAANRPDQRQVTIAATVADDKIEVSVEDLGEGIPAENSQRVFEAFFTNKPNGVGIGLAISRSIVEDHGGRLWLIPNPERGVTFHFTLPMSGVQDARSTDRFRRG